MRRLLADRSGATIVEFALACPVLLFLIFAGLEVGYVAYVKAVLEGEMYRASRDRTMQSATSDAQRELLERRVRDAVRGLAPEAEVQFSRTAYRDYSDVAQKEPFNDANNNGRCDGKEVYMDSNNNGTWDLDGGRANSSGSGSDIVVYTATVDYSRLPLGQMLRWGNDARLTARTALRNQPFDDRATVLERNCAG